MSSYLVPSRAVPVSAGMIVAVPAELLVSPLKSGREPGDSDRSALAVGGTERIRSGGAVVFCKVIVVAEAQVKRDGQVRAKGSPVRHATLGPLEEAGPGHVALAANRAPLDARFVKERQPPSVTKSRNYPQPLKQLKPMALRFVARASGLTSGLPSPSGLLGWRPIWSDC